MAKSHYEVLGLTREAAPADVRSAYRKIAFVHHPDRSKHPQSSAIFMAATAAYEVLSDETARNQYDEMLDLQIRRAEERRREQERLRQQQMLREQSRLHDQQRLAEKKQKPRPSAGKPSTRTDPRSISLEILRLTSLYARGNHAEAQRLALRIVNVAPRNPAPYAVLGDIARMRGDVNEALKMYAYAAQFEPANAAYRRRYEDLLNGTKTVTDARQTTTLVQQDRNVLAPMAAGGLVVLAAMYVGWNSEAPVFHRLHFISTWTLGLVVMLFLCGVSVGACFSAGNLLDRFEAVSISASGRVAPAVALALVALVNFWAALALYLILGLFQRAWNFSMTRLLGGVAVTLLVLTLAGAVGESHISSIQTLLWGGNLSYLGALLGWLVADSFRT